MESVLLAPTAMNQQKFKFTLSGQTASTHRSGGDSTVRDPGKLGECICAFSGKGLYTKIDLSRPAVSHHLQILKDAGLINVRKEGTMNYYYFDSNMKSMKKLIAALQAAVDVASQIPDSVTVR